MVSCNNASVDLPASDTALFHNPGDSIPYCYSMSCTSHVSTVHGYRLSVHVDFTNAMGQFDSITLYDGKTTSAMQREVYVHRL